MINKTYLEEFLEEFEYQSEAREAYRAVAAALDKNPEAEAELCGIAEGFFSKPQDSKAIIAALTALAERLAIPVYTFNFFAFITATERLRGIWRDMGISDAVAHNSLRDSCQLFLIS